VRDPHPLLVALGQTIRDLRFEQRVSQEELSLRTGVHRNYIGGIERAERQPTVLTVARLAEGLGVRASDLVARAEQRAGATKPA
jgi:transcriptional regulator with XRE-family HTH domain